MSKKKPLNMDRVGEQVEDAFTILGKSFVKLGTALQNHDSKIEDLSNLAFNCGLKMEFDLVRRTVDVESIKDLYDNALIELSKLRRELSEKEYERIMMIALTGIRSVNIRDHGNDLCVDVEWYPGAPYGPAKGTP